MGANPLVIPVTYNDYVLIDNGKKPDEPYNARLGFWLPPATPYGNFQLKWMKVVERLDQANRRIEESRRLWELINRARGGMLSTSLYTRHVLANEEAVYMMRRAADELVSLIWCLSEHERTGVYPVAIKVDCLGQILNAFRNKASIRLYEPHLQLIAELNDIANAFKHSFVNSDITVWGAEEPCLHALGLDHNRIGAGAKFYGVRLVDFVHRYNAFYQTCLGWLRSYSERNRDR